MRKTKNWLGLDIGGANLKGATADGFAREVAFPLWKKPNELSAAIANLIAAAPPHDGIGVTMTGELADCFASKAEGVAAIITAVEQAAGGRPTRYYALSDQLGGATLDAGQAIEKWSTVAAANWHALASVVDAELLIDIGSTTTDIIPGRGSLAVNDTDRLVAGQLLYQGVGRTPVCAVVNRLPYRGAECPVAAELFATTADVALLLGHVEPSECCDTADGQPFTEQRSIVRLGRMLCADETQFNHDDAIAVANRVRERLELRLVEAIGRVADDVGKMPEQVLLTGGGAWLARRALQRMGCTGEIVLLADQIGAAASRCGPAWAVAKLMDES